MKLPSSSSLLLASLAVSASSSSSLSALAAPASDLPEDSSSPTPVAPCGDGAVTRSLDHPQSRDIVDVVPALEPLKPLLDSIGRTLSRDFESAANGDSNGPGSPASPPPAPPSTPAPPKFVGPPVAPPQPPVKPPVNVPVA